MGAWRQAASALVGRTQAALQALPLEVLGLGMQVLGTMCVSVMTLCAKVVQQAGVPVFEVVLARSLVLVLFSIGLLVRERANPLKSQRKLLLLARGFLGFGAVSSIYVTVSLLPLADAAVLAFLAPIFVAVVGPCILGEPASRGVVFALPLAVFGVVLVAQPTAIFGGDSRPLSAWGIATGVLQAVFSASAKMSIRVLNSSEPVASIVFSQSAVSFIGSAVLCAVLPHHFVRPPSAGITLVLMTTGIMGCGVQMLNTLALKYASAAPVMAMSYVAVLWGLLFDVTVFHQPLSALALAGAGLVCCSSFIVVWDRRKAAQEQQPAARDRHGQGTQHAYELVGSAKPTADEEAAAEPASPEADAIPAKLVASRPWDSSQQKQLLMPTAAGSSLSPGRLPEA